MDDDILRCSDCGRENRNQGEIVDGFGSAITHTGESRIYCEDCRYRRGAAYIFDERPWPVIERALRKGAA